MSFHIISYRFYQPHFIRFDGTMRNDTIWSLSCAQRQNCTICIHMHLRYSWWIDWDISSQTNPETSGFISINIIQYWICGDVTWHKWNSGIKIRLEHLIFKILDKQEPWSRRTCNVLMGSSPNFTHTHTYCMKMVISFLYQCKSLDFAFWVFITAQWKGAKTASKECWGPCHGIIASLWDFAQNYSPQIEHRHQNWRGTIYSVDSEKAIEPRISLVTECLSWSTLDWVVALVVQVCAEICPVCLFQPRTPWHDIKPLPEWKVEKVEDKMATCVNTFQHLEMSAVRRKTPFPDSILGFDEGDSAQWLFSNERTWWNNWTHCSNEYVEWKLEKAEYAEFNLPTCGNIAVWQLCRERQPITVSKSRDGLNLTCLDQCHGVRFHGTSTSQGWRKRIVVQSTV